MSVVLVSDYDRRQRCFPCSSGVFWRRVEQDQFGSGCSASLCWRCDIRKTTSYPTGRFFPIQTEMRSTYFNGTRVCARLVRLVWADEMKKEGEGGRKTAKIEVPDEYASSNF